jgi:hypothetical protein
MNIRATNLAIFLILLSWTGLGHGAHGIVEESYELAFDAVTLPVHPTTGHVKFKLCANCGDTMLNVDEDTTYHNGIRTPAISLAELQFAATQQDAQLIYVYYDPSSEVVTRVVLSTLSID